jgi:hypothetical protein
VYRAADISLANFCWNHSRGRALYFAQGEDQSLARTVCVSHLEVAEMSNTGELQAAVPTKASQGLTSRNNYLGTSMQVSAALGHVGNPVHRTGSYFRRSWPYAVMGLGAVATLVWNAFLVYAVIILVIKE